MHPPFWMFNKIADANYLEIKFANISAHRQPKIMILVSKYGYLRSRNPFQLLSSDLSWIYKRYFPILAVKLVLSVNVLECSREGQFAM